MAPALRRIRRAKLNKRHVFNVCEVTNINGTPTALAVAPRSVDATGQSLADAVLKSSPSSPSQSWVAGEKAVVLFDAQADSLIKTGPYSGPMLVLSDFVVSEDKTLFTASAASADTSFVNATPRDIGVDKHLFEKLQSAFARLLGVDIA